MRRIIASVTVLTALGLLAGVLPSQAATRAASTVGTAASSRKVDLHPVTVVTGLVQPVQVTSANDGTSRLFVVEKAGTIRLVSGKSLQTRPYLDLRSKVETQVERGMLSVAFSPNFRTNHFLFVSYVRKPDGALVISRFKASKPNSTRISASTERVVFVVPRPSASSPIHNGGALAFGIGGYLYISTGDGGGPGDPYNTAQSARKLNGKILRIDVNRSCGTKRYCIPSKNPYARSATYQRAIYVRGFRNPWRMSIDRATGYLWVGDVGQDRWEEIDVVKASTAGRNFGWSCKEGRSTYNAKRCSGAVLIPPVMTLCHPDAVSGCTEANGAEAIIGGLVYRGKAYRSLLWGRYLFGDYITGNLWVTSAGGRTRRAGSLPHITSFGTDDAGEPYAVTLDGRLVRFSVRPAA